MDNNFPLPNLDWQSWINAPYFVELLGWPGLPAKARGEAEMRFAAELDRNLGGPAAVVEMFWRDYTVRKDKEERAVPDVPPAAESDWDQALKNATAAAFHGMSPPPSAIIWCSMCESVYERPDGA
ncbi:hypothetical protein [Caenimonas soli]|uniref:hypothetical protein n=1 Tax=Caenimonas soli TaxID=2735555 RepID=UPI001552FC70|nr:hypothetical protein [Caenimonas soli]NPC57818.1 hypothetical protein [Caenimonas soli]